MAARIFACTEGGPGGIKTKVFDEQKAEKAEKMMA